MKLPTSSDYPLILHGDCVEQMRLLPEASVDAVVTDPPYALPGGFMGKSWDAFGGREDAGFAYWLAGLIDGEGHFAIKRHSRGTHAPYFQLKMRRDERGTLEIIKRTLGVGTLRDTPAEPHPQSVYLIQDKAGCQRLIDLLDKYPLRAKKRLDYQIWREAVCEWTDRPRGNRWHGPVDDTRMAELRTQIMEVRHYVDPPWSGHEFQDWCRLWLTECLRVLKPGGHLLAFGGTRTWHRLACAVEDTGFEIRDSMAWLYGSGFPKSLDVSKAIDRAAGALAHESKRFIVAGQTGKLINPPTKGYVPPAPATDAVKQWQGWGTALKPAFEPIVVARKPLTGTVAANVLAHGTGALNVDGCRVGTGDTLGRVNNDREAGSNAAYFIGNGRGGTFTTSDERGGRWPANVVLDEHTAAIVDQQSGVTTAGAAGASGTSGFASGYDGEYSTPYGDTGGASRFFYVAKAPGEERPTGNGTAHPTVKPLDLMRWLVRLVTPPGGIVLEPFAGSGTTVEACIKEDVRCIAIEREADYLPLIDERINRNNLSLFAGGEA